MNKFSLITQVAMIVVAVTIVIMYIQPKVSSIRDIQDLTTSYQTETDNVSAVNESLKAKVTQIDAIAPQDTAALTRFIPDTLDDIAVLKDISNIVELGTVRDYDVSYKGNNAAAIIDEQFENPNPGLTEHYFALTFESNYSQLKSVLSLLETNNYILQVENLKVTAMEEGTIKSEMSLTAFSRAQAVPEVTP
jgi:hypothetical protein